jgi:hypothetical protein
MSVTGSNFTNSIVFVSLVALEYFPDSFTKFYSALVSYPIIKEFASFLASFE